MMRKSLPKTKKVKKGDKYSNTRKREPVSHLIICPLCCNESFTTQEALKCHLHNAIKNVICPICFQHCENVMCLVKHLDIGCGRFQSYEDQQIVAGNGVSIQDNTFTLVQNTLALVSFKEDEALDQALLDDLQTVGENTEIETKEFPNNIEPLDTNIDVSDDVFDSKSTIKQEKIETPENETLESEECLKFDIESVTKEEMVPELNDSGTEDACGNEESESELDEYKCSACNMCFNSIKDHVTQFHSGEEVRVEGADEKLKTKLQECGVVVDDIKGSNCIQEQTQENVAANESLSVQKEHIEEKNYHTHNTMGYWSKRGTYYNFVKNEEKMRLLFPSFVPSETKVKTSSGCFNKKQKNLFNNLDLIQIVDDKSLLGSVDPSLITIYIVHENKTKDSSQLGPIAKLIPNLPISKKKAENDDKYNSEVNEKFSDYNRHSSQYIQVLKVPLENDMEITIENVDFDVLPPVSENIIPYLDAVTNPKIPMLKEAKQLKWQCSLCLSHVSSVYMTTRRHNCYKCKYCGKGFKKNISVFMKHLLECGRDKANAEKPFACSCCPSYFRTIKEARKHMPLHYPGSKAVQCSICYCLLSDKTILNEHLINEHNTDLSKIDDPVKQPRLKAKSKFVIDSSPTCSSSPVSNDSPSTCSVSNRNKYKKKRSYKSNSEPRTKTSETFSEVEINENMEDLISPRSSRKRKINKSYFEEYFVY